MSFKVLGYFLRQGACRAQGRCVVDQLNLMAGICKEQVGCARIEGIRKLGSKGNSEFFNSDVSRRHYEHKIANTKTMKYPPMNERALLILPAELMSSGAMLAQQTRWKLMEPRPTQMRAQNRRGAE
jgi:hypothetical protein